MTLLAAMALSTRHACAASLPPSQPFVLADCLAVLDEDPENLEDYLTAHVSRGQERSVQHCRAVAGALTGKAAEAAAQLDTLAHTPAPRSSETDMDDDSPDERANVAEDAARAWLAAGDAAQAERSAHYGLGLTPLSVTLQLLRDRAWLLMGNNVEALKNLTSLAGNPILATETHRLKAMAEVQVNNLAAADQDINVTLRDEPDDPAALLERGIIRQRMNDMKGARSDWEQVVDLAPDSHEADLARQDLDLLASDPDAMTGAGSDGVAQTVSTSH